MVKESSFFIEEIYELYYRDVYHFTLFYTNNKQEAEDITQETFIKALKGSAQLKDPTKIKSWILSIAKNTAIDFKRKQKFIQYIPQLIFSREQVSNDVDVDKQIIHKEDWKELQEALLKLKPHYRSLVILRGIKELSIQEVSEILGCTELKVRVDYHRAINLMKKHMVQNQERWSIYEQSK